MKNFIIKRIYEPYDKHDGVRILVDRLWPRGIKKENAHIDNWMKDIAPSTALRKWFHQDRARWDEFKERYILELKNNSAVDKLLNLAHEHKQVTLIYAAHDEQQNHALVLQNFLQKLI